jgi:hypothetical protein
MKAFRKLLSVLLVAVLLVGLMPTISFASEGTVELMPGSWQEGLDTQITASVIGADSANVIYSGWLEGNSGAGYCFDLTSDTESFVGWIVNGVEVPYHSNVTDMDEAVYDYIIYGEGYWFVSYKSSTSSVPELLLSFDQEPAALHVKAVFEKADTGETLEFTKNLKTYETVLIDTSLTLSVEATAVNNGTVSYQWQQSPDKTNWNDIQDAISSSYAPATNAGGKSYYKVVATSGGISLDSNVVTVTVLPATENISATFNFSAQDKPLICTVGSNPAFTANCSGGNNYYYEWFKDGVSQVFSKSATTFYADTCTEGTHIYYCIASVDDNYYFESDHIEVKVEAAPSVPAGAYEISIMDDPNYQGAQPKAVSIAGAGVTSHSTETNAAEYDRIYNIQLSKETADNATITLYFECQNNTYDNSRGNLPVLSSVGEEEGTRVSKFKDEIAAASFRTLNVSLKDGTAQAVVYAYNDNNSYSRGTRTKYIFNFSKEITEETAILDAVPTNGQWLMKSDLFTKKSANLALPYGQTTVDLTLTFDSANAMISVNDTEAQAINADKTCSVTLNSSPEGTANKISVVKEGVTESSYTVTCFTQKYSGLPDAVTDYLCIGSQYTNGLGISDYGLRGVATLLGSNKDAIDDSTSGPASLGNFGGYITYYYEDALYDDPKNPYGIDFITFGNSVEGSNVFAEPGQVWVSENGADWYALAGALHYDNTALWDYSITYTKLENGRTSWTDNKGNSAIQPYYEYPLPEYYPLFDWTEALENSMTLSGILLQTQEGTNEYGNLLPPFPDFGYTDVGLRGTLVDGLLTGDNKAGNPYLGSYTKGNRQYLSVTDGMDLAWAVDENGQPVTFENGVHYVKIVTASNIENGAIGEKSTEVNMVRVAAASESEVGQTAAPSAIKVDGNALALTEGKYIYDNVAVDGPFAVSVDAAEGVNIYINSSRGHNAVFSGMPNHKMIRIIVQEGEKEPVIYYLNLVESSGEPEPAATLTLDPNGGVLGGSSEALTYAFDAHMSHIALPIPTTKNTNLEFAGWYSSDQKLYTTYPSEVKDLTLTARWKEIGSEVPSDTIDVTFRLIGCTLAELEDEFDSIDLADGDYKGAEYVTWIATKNYTLPENSTVLDLFEMALTGAGLTWKNPGGDYITTINAPDVYGGYELSEFTNGNRSGWMYTLNGNHALFGVSNQKLSQGDEIIFHYVNDFAYEVHDWDKFGGSPALGDGTYWSKWLEAADETLESNEEAVAKAKTAIENQTWTVPMDTANTEQAVKAWIESEIANLDMNGVTAIVTMDSFTPAVAGTEANPSGTEGNFNFTVNLNKGEGDTLATDNTQITGTITAYPVDNEDAAAAKNVDNLITAISDPVTLGDKTAIESARAAYNALTQEQKDLVTKLAKLEAAETTLADLQAAKDAEDKIAAIGIVTLESKSLIDTAREAYDALTDEQAMLVSNYQTLLTAEEAYAALMQPIKETEGLINKLPDTISTTEMTALAKASEAYNNLSDDEKTQIDAKLKTKLSALQNEAAAINHTSNGVQISGVPWNIILTAVPFTAGEDYEAMQKLGAGRTVLGMYDLSLQSLGSDGNIVEYQLNGETATITLTVKDLAKYKEIKIIHQLPNGEYEYITPTEIDGSKITFVVKSLSKYAVTGKLIETASETTPTTGDDQGKSPVGPVGGKQIKTVPATGDPGYVLMMIMFLLAVLCAGGYVYCKKARGKNSI